MFRTLIYPSSGACDCAVKLPHWSFCSCFAVCWRFGVMPLLQAEAACNTGTTQTRPHQISNTQRTENKTTDVVIQQHSRKLLMMDILMSETCWVQKKWNKIASDIKLVFYSSAITMTHGPLNISRIKCRVYNCSQYSDLTDSATVNLFSKAEGIFLKLSNLFWTPRILPHTHTKKKKIFSLMIKFPESGTGNSLPCNVEDDVVELYIHSALYIHGVTNNEANSVWEYSAKEDVFGSRGQDNRELEKTAWRGASWFIPTECYSGDDINKNESGGACGQ